MTTRQDYRTPSPSRPNGRGSSGERRARQDGNGRDSLATPGLPERLAAARERKGVDLYRAERDTKIRSRYLSALERGDYRELPAPVYVKGFLRNYATYLGLDPDEVIEQWRQERGDALPTPAITGGPRPLEAPRPSLTFSPGILVAALLTIGVVIFAIYLGLQLFRFAKPPTIAVTQPAVAVTDVDETVTEYTLRGTSVAGATIEISSPGQERPYRVTADPDGDWTATVELNRGRNQFEVTAKDPETGKAAETPVQLVFNVPFPVVAAPTLTLDQPADGATYENGAITIQGSTTNADTVTYTAVAVPEGGVEPVPSPAPTDPASPAPDASGAPPEQPPGTELPLAEDGTFGAPIELTTGTWLLTVTATSPEGKTVALSRTVTIQYRGVNVVVSIVNARAWLKVWVDGKLDESIGAGGKVFAPGKVLTFTGQDSVEVRTGRANATQFTVNGTELGTLAKDPNPGTWLFAPPDPPQRTDRR